jgi:hypothetical protein
VIELHDHVGAEVAFDGHHRFGSELALRAIDVAAELDALFSDSPERLQGEDLKTARVGEDRAIPAHERVEAAHLRDQVIARAQVEVVGVREDHLGARLAELARVEGLHRRLGTDRHEGRRRDGAVRGRENAGAGGAGVGVEREAEGHDVECMAGGGGGVSGPSGGFSRPVMLSVIALFSGAHEYPM